MDQDKTISRRGARHVIVIGGGVVGLMSAWQLVRRGFRVSVLEKEPEGCGASWANAGLIVPSHVVPLAAPGVVAQGLRWMLRSDSPFYIRPRLSRSLLSWTWRFRRSCTQAHMEASVPLLATLTQRSLPMWDELDGEAAMPDFRWRHQGLIMLYRTDKGRQTNRQNAERARQMGLPAEHLDGRELRRHYPVISEAVQGGYYYPCDGHLRPELLINGLRKLLQGQGVAFHSGVQARSFFMEGGKARITGHSSGASEEELSGRVSDRIAGRNPSGRWVAAVRTSEGDLEADAFVLANGAWAPGLAQSMGLRLPMEPAKGYSITMARGEMARGEHGTATEASTGSGHTTAPGPPPSASPSPSSSFGAADGPSAPASPDGFPAPASPDGLPVIPLMLTDDKVTVTPYDDAVRFAGTLELSGYDAGVDRRRLQGITDAVPRYLDGWPVDGYHERDLWAGHRPCSPDGLPYVGRTQAADNVVVAVGHAMIGMSLAPVTGRLVSEMLTGEPPSVAPSLLALMDPDRYA